MIYRKFGKLYKLKIHMWQYVMKADREIEN